MIRRWFVAAYSISVITGFTTAHWAFPTAVPGIIGLLFIPFALPFVLAGSLIGWGTQRAVERLMGAGWERTTILACVSAAVGGIGMALITRTPLYAITAVVSAVSGAVLSQHEMAWRRGWLVVLLGVGIATLLGIGLMTKPM